jgi:hypothetical protein
MPVEANGQPLSVRIASGKPTCRKSARNTGWGERRLHRQKSTTHQRTADGHALRAARGPGRNARLLALLDDYGPAELTAAVTIALACDALGAGAIAHLLETRRRRRGQVPSAPISLMSNRRKAACFHERPVSPSLTCERSDSRLRRR